MKISAPRVVFGRTGKLGGDDAVFIVAWYGTSFQSCCEQEKRRMGEEGGASTTDPTLHEA